ncbi:transmembrane protein 216 isoform X3 [Scleropages formosus]|uniref:transmembrane protein 216 isoform X3 n=1 Tax=Scleropages formosus TaxID=113540 RepID=UPI0010FA6663|nr:transmembrane protein 216-like isoform X3 [Scleropages formosus]
MNEHVEKENLARMQYTYSAARKRCSAEPDGSREAGGGRRFHGKQTWRPPEKMKLYPFCVYIYVTDMYWAPRYYSASSSTVRQLSSVPLQVLLTLNGWYFGGFFIAELLMFVYKGVLLPYPPGNLVLDLMLLFLFLGLEILRIFYGSKGNLCEQTLATVLSVGILVPCAVLSVYFLLLQTFVLRLEVIVNALLLCFYGFELLLCLTGLIAFSRG